MNLKIYIQGFKSFLTLERSLSANTIESYLRDIEKFNTYLVNINFTGTLKDITIEHLQGFIVYLNGYGISANSQARTLSGIKSFYKYLLLEDIITVNPTDLLEAPKTGRKLPETLSLEEINKLISCIDLSTTVGYRNKAMLETLYSCGLRVSELVNLKMSNLYFNDGFIKIIGKGDKERLVPIGSEAIKYITIYRNEVRCHQSQKKGYEDILFLSERGTSLTRVMIFTIIKRLAQLAGIQKAIGPHTFRHSFATHLVDGGADLRAVQEMLGHESITTTEIYTHLDRHYLRQEILLYHPRSSQKKV